MNRSESAGSASFRNPSRQIQSANIPYFDANTNFMYNSQARPKSDKSFDESSVQSYGAVEGSLRNSMVSILSNSKKSQISYMSNYPPIKIKQFPKNDRKHPDLTSGKNNEHKRSTNSVKSIEETNIKKRKAEYYVDEDYFYSSQFKRNFVKGMLTLAKNKNISDLSLLLREVAPTIMVKSEDTSIWVSAYLLIFKIEFQMRKVKLNEQVLSELLQDELVDYMLKNRQAKKARIIKILIYVFKEIPIFKPKVVQWFEQFIKKNKDRLRSIDLSKYIDLNQINTRIDFANINKSANIKAKQIDKQRQKEKRRDMEKFKQQMVQKRERVQQRPKSKASQFRNESRTQRRSQKSVEIPRQTPRQTPKQNLKQTIKQTPRQTPKQIPRQTPRQRIQNKNLQNDQVVRLSGLRQEIPLKKQKNERKNEENVPKQSKNQTIQNKIVPNSSENKSLGAQNIKSNIPVKKEDKNQQPPQNKLSLQQMIARRIQGAFPPSEKNKSKKSQGSIKQNKQKKDSVNNEKLVRQRKEQEKRKIEVENQRKNQQALQQKNEKLKERIKLLAKNRQEQLKSQVQQPEISPENPKPKKQNYQLPSAYNSFQPYSSAHQYSFLEDISGNKNNGRNKRDNRINVDKKNFSNQNYEDHSQSNQNSNDSLDSCVAIQNENEGESYDQENIYKNYQLNEEDLELNADENQLQGSQEAEEFDQEDYQNYGNF